MRITGDLDSMKIIAPELRPFTSRDLTICPACGISASGRWRRFLRMLRGKKDELVVSMNYCPGDKPPSEESKGISLLMFYGSGDVVNRCSGIPTAHLHVRCSHCRAEWFTALKEGK